MSTLADQVAEQRRRLKSVRMMLTTAVARTSQGDPQFAPFYVAIGDYMEAAMGGLHAQDVKMGRMIRHKLGTPDAAAEQALGELDQRLAGNQKFLQIMLAGREGLLTSQAPAALLAFEQAGHAYAHYIVSQMGHHGVLRSWRPGYSVPETGKLWRASPSRTPAGNSNFMLESWPRCLPFFRT